MTLLSLLVVLIVVCALFWAANAIMGAFGVGDPLRTLIYVAFVLIVVVWLISQLGGVNLSQLRL